MVKRKSEDPTTPPPDPGAGKRGTEGHIAYLLRQAQTAVRHRIDGNIAGLGVTYPQFTVMTMIRAYDGPSGADLARLSLLTPQTVAVIVRNLLRDGLVRREKHPVHGRILRLALTDDGAALLARCRRRVAKVDAAMVDGLSAADEAVIRNWLVRLAVRD
jgi:DNA-binding MarR family transcriptional regulator